MNDPRTSNLSETLIQRFVDGEVTEDQDRAIRLHLRESAEARALVLEAERTRHLLRASAGPVAAVPPGFAARVAREAFAAEARVSHELSSALPFVRRLAFAAVAAGLGLAVLWLLARRVEDWTARPEVGASQVLSVKDFASPHEPFLRAPAEGPRRATDGRAAGPRGGAEPVSTAGGR